MELAEIRRGAGYSGPDFAKRLGWDQSKVSRLEKGKQAIEELDLMTWLLLCEVKSSRLRQIVQRNRDVMQETWVVPYGLTSGDSRYVMIGEEHESKTITIYACLLIPALLQTPAYMHAVLEHFYPDDEAKIEQVAACRAGRQEVLRGANAPQVTFYLEESVLGRPVGNEQIHHDQLMHLMFMSNWTKVRVRVLPTALGVHSASQGAFTLIQRRDKRWVACVHTETDSLIVENVDRIERYKTTVEDLAASALSEEESRALIGVLADEFGCSREDRDTSQSEVA